MRKYAKIFCLFICFLTGRVSAAESLANEAPVRFIGGLSWGFTELTFDEKLDADVAFNTLTATGALSRGKIYSSLSLSGSLATENISEEDEIGTARRADIDLTFGYRTDGRWSVFGGYRAGSTDIDFTIRDTTINQSEFYRENGVFAGVSYSHSLGRSGSLSISAAFSRYETDLKFTAGFDEEEDEEEQESEAEEAIEFDDIEGRNSGKANGISLGLSWVVPLEKSIALNAQYKINLYDLEVRTDDNVFKPVQRLVYFNLGLLYVF